MGTTTTTAATRFLEERGVPFVTHGYDYVERGGARHAAASLGIDEHRVIKTLVMRTDRGDRVLVLMHGDRQVSTRQLARELGARRVNACSPDEARKATGYVVGGISPFGTRQALRVVAESTIFELSPIYVNGGRRGLLLELSPAALVDTLEVRRVSVSR